MLLWASGHDKLPNDTLVGQINMQLDELQETHDGVSEQIREMDVCMANLRVAKAHIKVAFKRV